MWTRLSPEKAANLHRLWEAGVAVAVIGDKLAMSPPTVVNWSKELGLPPRRRGGQSGPATRRAGGRSAKQRKCLGGCGKEFASDHKGNRVCDTCKAKPQWLSGNDYTLRGPAAG